MPPDSAAISAAPGIAGSLAACSRAASGADPVAPFVRARDVVYAADGTRFLLESDFGKAQIQSPLLGAFNVDNLLAVLAVYMVGQGLESFVLTPRLVGERIGLNPLAVIFALLAFGQLLGFVGVLIALPVSAVLLVAIRRIRQGYLASGLYQG